MANAAKGNQAIPRVSSNLHFVTYLCLFVSTYLGNQFPFLFLPYINIRMVDALEFS
ncbi:hypothetical protein Aazo_3696 ['Nostoc azollae' 0708]|uniref:Uncharacterized protein n=1 Tax=Nostoc azollae (strain 0708) TaxID=551115 RepID=D7E431_NOSA0|nr:hypothetical protein Aazo_3696 ['Nostoc azollae' 0708]